MILTNEQHYHAIADAIRSLTGTETAYTPEQMAPAITAAGSGGISQDYWKAFLQRTITEAEIPEGVTVIGERMFHKCSALTSVTIPEGVQTIGGYAFFDCRELNLSALPDSVTAIGDSAFRAAPITLTQLPPNLGTIGTYGFAECSQLAITQIPASVTEVGVQAFSRCIALTEITFLGTPATVGRNAFAYCSGLTTINVPWAEGDAVNANAPWGATDATIVYGYVPGGQA